MSPCRTSSSPCLYREPWPGGATRAELLERVGLQRHEARPGGFPRPAAARGNARAWSTIRRLCWRTSPRQSDSHPRRVMAVLAELCREGVPSSSCPHDPAVVGAVPAGALHDGRISTDGRNRQGRNSFMLRSNEETITGGDLATMHGCCSLAVPGPHWPRNRETPTAPRRRRPRPQAPPARPPPRYGPATTAPTATATDGDHGPTATATPRYGTKARSR